MIPLICESKVQYKQTYLQNRNNRNRITDIENRLVVARGKWAWGRERSWIVSISECFSITLECELSWRSLEAWPGLWAQAFSFSPFALHSHLAEGLCQSKQTDQLMSDSLSHPSAWCLMHQTWKGTQIVGEGVGGLNKIMTSVIKSRG